MNNPNPPETCYKDSCSEFEWEIEDDIQHLAEIDESIAFFQNLYNTHLFYSNTQFRIKLVESIQILTNKKAEILLRCGIISQQ